MSAGFMVGDLVTTPAADWVATVVYLCDDGRIAVEYPDDARWYRWWPEELRPIDGTTR